MKHFCHRLLTAFHKRAHTTRMNTYIHTLTHAHKQTNTSYVTQLTKTATCTNETMTKMW